MRIGVEREDDLGPARSGSGAKRLTGRTAAASPIRPGIDHTESRPTAIRVGGATVAGHYQIANTAAGRPIDDFQTTLSTGAGLRGSCTRVKNFWTRRAQALYAVPRLADLAEAAACARGLPLANPATAAERTTVGC